MRHGDRRPLLVPPPELTEPWLLYLAMAGPLEPCGPDCDALCVCPGEVDQELPEAA